MINMHPLFRHGKDVSLPVQTLTPFVYDISSYYMRLKIIYSNQKVKFDTILFIIHLFLSIYYTFINATHIFILFYSLNLYTEEKSFDIHV